jgi:hypothetical protein
MKLEFSLHIFEKPSDTKFNENPSCGRRVVPYGRTEGHTDTTKLTDLFVILETHLKNDLHCGLRVSAGSQGPVAIFCKDGNENSDSE